MNACHHRHAQMRNRIALLETTQTERALHSLALKMTKPNNNLPVWALLITLVCGTPLAKAWVTWLTSPAPFHVSSALARVPTPTLHLGLGSLSSSFELVECTHYASAEQVPLRHRWIDNTNQWEITLGCQRCQPCLWGSGRMVNDVESDVDTCTSDGWLAVRPLNEPAAECAYISWSMVGTSAGSCTINMEDMGLSNGRMLQALRSLHSQMRHQHRREDLLATARVAHLPNGDIAFLSANGKITAQGERKEAAWVLEIRAALHELYRDPQAEIHWQQVSYLILDHVLNDSRFQNEVAFAMSHNT